MNSKTPLSKLLLPVSDEKLFANTLPLVQLFAGRFGEDRLQTIDLLHVVGGSFLTSHLANIDLRAGRAISSETIDKLRREHGEKTVDPLLKRIQRSLNVSGVRLKVGVLVEEGDPVKKICQVCESENYSTMVLARRKKEDEDFFTGSVVNGILGRFLDASLYIVGENGFDQSVSPAARVVIGVDGSRASLKAVEEAGLLLARCSDAVEKISLLNVLDQSCFFGDGGLDCKKHADIAHSQMEQAEKILVERGVAKTIIEPTVLFGHPAEMLVRHARDIDATLTFIGRRDRSKIAEVLLGSVCGAVIHQLRDRGLVLVG